MSNDTTFSKAFSGLRDPRHRRNLRYPLVDVPALAACAILCGKRCFTEMEHFLKLREERPAGLFGLASGVPSHDVFSRVFRLFCAILN